MTSGIFGIDILVFVIVCVILLLAVLIVWLRLRGPMRRGGSAGIGPDDEISELASRIKYPQSAATGAPDTAGVIPVTVRDEGIPVRDVELVRDRRDITASLKALADKYSLSEIILATDDGLVFAALAGRDVQNDAVKYSQIARNRSLLKEPDVTLFELEHRDSRLFGIVRSTQNLSLNQQEQIRDDTKVILQWWL